MPNPRPARPFQSFNRGRGGFSLSELLLVTVGLGLLATIVAPYFGSARERALASQMKADIRHLKEGVETFTVLNGGRFPGSLEELEEGSTYNQTAEVEYCTFLAVPPSSLREGYVIAMAAHPATTLKMFIVYPLWGNQILEFDSGRRGC